MEHTAMERAPFKVAFHTLGCKVNQSETEEMCALFSDRGYQIGAFEEFADIYVINTCTVTHTGDQKSRQMIRRVKQINPEAVVVVTGCYAQVSPEEVARIEDVDIILGTNKRQQIVEQVEGFLNKHEKVQLVSPKETLVDFEEIPANRLIQKTRAYLKVQEGCEQFCSYCIIPYARGPFRSRSLESSLKEAKRLEQAGFHEIILTGIHLGAYGHEHGRYQLADLCAAILEETAVERIRLSSVEPTEINTPLLSLLAENRRMCRHLHLPLQAGSDQILERMNRPYRTEDYRRELTRIREAVPGIAISTDLMVGFPGETEELFEKSLQFCDQMSFSSMHIFKYSPRQGTPAAAWPDQIGNEEKNRRSRIMQQMAKAHMQSYMESHLGSITEVLLEEQNAEGDWLGHTDHYLKVCCNGPGQKHTFVQVQLVKIAENHLIGKIIR